MLECGEQHVKSRLSGKRYFYELLDSLEHTPESAIKLLTLSRGMSETFQDFEQRLLKGLERHPLLAELVVRLESIRGVEPRDGAELGAGSQPAGTLVLGRPRGELLRFVSGTTRVVGHATTHAFVEAAQPLLADGVDRSGKLAPAL